MARASAPSATPAAMTVPDGTAQWEELPPGLRAVVEARAEGIDTVEASTAGRYGSSPRCCTQRVVRSFCKGIRSDADLAWTQRNELKVNPALPAGIAPHIRWNIESDGWMLTGFDHVVGRAPDISPGSPDLDLVAGALAELSTALTPRR